VICSVLYQVPFLAVFLFSFGILSLFPLLPFGISPSTVPFPIQIVFLVCSIPSFVPLLSFDAGSFSLVLPSRSSFFSFLLLLSEVASLSPFPFLGHYFDRFNLLSTKHINYLK